MRKYWCCCAFSSRLLHFLLLLPKKKIMYRISNIIMDTYTEIYVEYYTNWLTSDWSIKMYVYVVCTTPKKKRMKKNDNTKGYVTFSYINWLNFFLTMPFHGLYQNFQRKRSSRTFFIAKLKALAYQACFFFPYIHQKHDRSTTLFSFFNIEINRFQSILTY